MGNQVVKTIQLTTALFTRAATSYAAPNARRRILWEAAAYGGTVEVYLEILMKSSSASYTAYATLYAAGGSAVTGAELTTTSTNLSRLRSGNIAGNLADATEYDIQSKSSSASGTCTVQEARLVIVISGTITALTENIELAYNATGFTTNYTNICSAKFLYTAANWNGTIAAYLEACLRSSATTRTVYADLWDLTANAEVASSPVSTTATGYVTRLRSGAITLVDGHEYEIRIKCSSTNSGNTIASGTLIIIQTNNPTKTESHYTVDVINVISGSTSYVTGWQNIYWDEDEWGTTTKTVYFEATLYSSGAYTTYGNIVNGGQLAEISTAATSPTRVRSAAITPSDNTVYYCQLKCTSAFFGNMCGPRFITLAVLSLTRTLLANIAGASTTPGIGSTTERALQSNLIPASTTPAIQAAIARYLLTNIPGVSNTPTINISIIRGLLTSLIALSQTPNISAITSRKLLASLDSQSTTPNIATTLARVLLANIPPASLTPDISATIIRNLMAIIPGASTTPGIIASVTRNISALLSAQSTAPEITQTVTRALLGNIQAASATADASIVIIRSLLTDIFGASTTPDITANIQGIINLVASITGASVTPAAAAVISRALLASISAQSNLQDIVAAITRKLFATVAGASTTPDITATLENIIELSAAIVGVSATPDIVAAIARSISGLISGQSVTPEVQADITRRLLANIQGTSVTPDDLILLLSALGAILDPSIESITPRRAFEFVTPKRDFISATPARGFDFVTPKREFISVTEKRTIHSV